ncbi:MULTISPECIES: hypothetical protein [Nocardia]|uniref:hypothetical protein n=1 Tax=Nocardia TaxID=1817 RepID=UPI001358C007|nr:MULTISPECIES: hypothetical protein [Nocardia]MBF6205244.1 hypothetical protein [Streptomyces gardneri]UAK31039.1 hypothetical protein K8O92_24750 [Nocardia asteroides]
MRDVDDNVSAGRGHPVRIPRSRGALGGLAVLLLGVWGALIPFLGPYFDFAFTPDEPWVWTSARGWLQVLPGVAAIIGGLLMLVSRNRIVASFGGWLAVAAGVWFVIGPVLAEPLRIGDVGDPVATSDLKRAVLQLTYFHGLGALILFFAATSLGRLSVRSARDIAFTRREADARAAAVTDSQRRIADAPGLEKPGPMPQRGRGRTSPG